MADGVTAKFVKPNVVSQIKKINESKIIKQLFYVYYITWAEQIP